MPVTNNKRRERIILATAEVMREKGVLATRLQDVGAHMGVTYTAIYHYFRNRDHLVREVLLWSLSKQVEMLKAATGDSALDRLLHFFEMCLRERHTVPVRLPFLYGLADAHRTAVAQAREKLRTRIADLLDDGKAQGSIRTGDSLTISNMMLVLLERYSVVDTRLFPAEIGKLGLDDFVSEICNTLRNGILRDPESLQRKSWRIEDSKALLSYDVEFTSELARLDNILSTATRHFNREGFNASIPRMAKELGASKTVVYQYATDKQDLLLQCYLRSLSVIESSHRFAAEHGNNPIDELMIHSHNVYSYHASGRGPLSLQSALAFLEPQHQRLIKLRNKGLQGVALNRLARAQKAKQVRADANLSVVQPIFTQMLYGLPVWYSGDYPIGIEEVCWQTLQVPLVGLENGAA